MSVGQIGDNMTPLREIVKALKEISEWPWWRDNHTDGQYSVWDQNDERIVPPKWNLATINFITASPSRLAEMVVRVVEERRLHYWNFHDSYAITAVLDKCLIKALSDPDINITPDDFAWLRGKVRG